MQTSKNQISLFGEDDAMSSLWDPHASPFPSRDRDKGLTIPATCGQKVIGQYKKFSLGSSFSKMFVGYLVGAGVWSSSRCVLTWKLRATKSHRLYFQLQVSKLRMKDIGSSLLPTVQTQGLKVCEDGRTKFMDLQLLPTPTAMDTGASTSLDKIDARRKKMKLKHNGKNGKHHSGNGFETSLGELLQRGLLPTPSASLVTGGQISDPEKVSITGKTTNGKKRQISLNDYLHRGLMPTPNTGDYLNNAMSMTVGETSQLNPRFVIEMMGMPPDWTVLPFLPGASSPFTQPETP